MKQKIESIKILGYAEDYDAQTFTYVAKVKVDEEYKFIGETFIFRRKLGIDNLFKTKNLYGLARVINSFEEASTYLTDLEILYLLFHMYKQSQYDFKEVADFFIQHITERETYE